jgi:hypothetical protein
MLVSFRFLKIEHFGDHFHSDERAPKVPGDPRLGSALGKEFLE